MSKKLKDMDVVSMDFDYIAHLDELHARAILDGDIYWAIALQELTGEILGFLPPPTEQ